MRNPGGMLGFALAKGWVPAFAGMTDWWVLDWQADFGAEAAFGAV